MGACLSLTPVLEELLCTPVMLGSYSQTVCSNEHVVRIANGMERSHHVNVRSVCIDVLYTALNLELVTKFVKSLILSSLLLHNPLLSPFYSQLCPPLLFISISPNVPHYLPFFSSLSQHFPTLIIQCVFSC